MSDEMIIHCCAPTMAALKTGSVFNCPFESEEEMRNSLSDINVCLKRKGVSVVALRYRKGAEVDVLTCSEVGDLSSYDSVALGCSAMGAEELEDSEFLPMLDKAEPQLGGKKVALFGSYGWGDGEWMRSWEARCKEKGIALPFGSVMAHEIPDAAVLAACKSLGETLA